MDIFSAHRKIVADYASYIRSFMNIGDPVIRAKVEEELAKGVAIATPVLATPSHAELVRHPVLVWLDQEIALRGQPGGLVRGEPWRLTANLRKARLRQRLHRRRAPNVFAGIVAPRQFGQCRRQPRPPGRCRRTGK